MTYLTQLLSKVRAPPPPPKKKKIKRKKKLKALKLASYTPMFSKCVSRVFGLGYLARPKTTFVYTRAPCYFVLKIRKLHYL